MNFEGAIFDLDGTLLNTLVSLAASFNRALDTMGYPEHPVAAYRYFIGDGARRCAERCLPPGSDHETVERCVSLQRGNYRHGWQEDTCCYEGIPELLGSLQERGLKLGVLSNKDDEFARKCVSHFFPETAFDSVIGASPSIPHKPDPAGGNLIAEQFQLDPGRIVYVGDSATDMRTAHACKMAAVGVLWGFRDRPELIEAGAHHIIARPSELLDLV